MLRIHKILIALFFICNPVLLFAQDVGSPCTDDNDPMDNACPLDNWIFLFVVLVVVIAIIHIYKTNKLCAAARLKVSAGQVLPFNLEPAPAIL
jgi:hypothetical protein